MSKIDAFEADLLQSSFSLQVLRKTLERHHQYGVNPRRRGLALQKRLCFSAMQGLSGLTKCCALEGGDIGITPRSI